MALSQRTRRRLPPLNSLRAFEAAARHQNLSRAAEELAVTHSAVSHQVAKLEDFLGGKLFERRQGQLHLNRRGVAYALRLQAVFDEIERATASSFLPRLAPDTIRIGVLPTFAMHFLVPRLAQFKREFPRLTLKMETADYALDPNSTDVDLAIWWWNTTISPELIGDFLFGEVLNPVSSPELVAGRRLERADDLEPFPLLHTQNRPHDWKQWLQAAKATKIDGKSGLQLGHSALAYQAAVNGLGVALSQPEFVAADVAAGRLVSLLNMPLRTEYAFYAVRSAETAMDSRVVEFTEWLKCEAAAAAFRTAPPQARNVPARAAQPA